MVRIFQRTELTFEQYVLAFLDSLPQISRNVANIRCEHLLVLHKSVEQLIRIDRRLVIQMLKQYVLLLKNSVYLLFQSVLMEQLLHLETDLCILIGIERCDTRLCRAEACLTESLLFILVEKNVIRHYHLRSVGNKYLWHGYALRCNFLNLIEEFLYIKSNTVADYICCMVIENARRQCVQSELAVVIHNRVSGICTALKSDNYVRLLSHHIGKLALTLVAPVCANNRSNHCYVLLSLKSRFNVTIHLCA